MNDDYRKAVGATIRKLRKEKGLSRDALAGPTNETYICSKDHLGRIERGEYAVSTPMLLRLLSVLGVSIGDFYTMVYGTDVRQFNKEFELVWELGAAKNYQTFNDRLNELKQKDYCNPNVPAIAQALYLCEGAVQYSLHKNYEASLNALYSGLRITYPHIVGNGTVNCTKLSKTVFNMNEHRILSMILCILADMGEINHSIEISKAVITSLENPATDRDVQKKVLPLTCYNISDTLIDMDRYEEAAEFAKRGIEFCIAAQNFTHIALLYYNCGKAIYSIGNKEQATILFQQAHDTFKAHGNTESAEFGKKTVKDKYGISLH